jgi:hypothetical protein
MCAMCGCNSEAFMGVENSTPSVINAGPSEMPSPEMFNTDSINNLGVSKTEMDMN